MTDDHLVELFAALAIDQDAALHRSDTRRYNKLFDRLVDIQLELKARPGDRRRALLRLYDHPNWQVRLMTAHAILAIAPEEGKQLLENIAASRHFPQAGDAGMALLNLERGTYEPT